MRAAIFDLDGTLADTSADLIAAANACFDAPQLDPVKDASTAFAGGRAMLRLGLGRMNSPWTEADVDGLYPHLLDFYGQNIDIHTRLYPGVEAALDRLASSGWALGICTNKPEGLAEDLVRRLGIRDRFQVLYGADSLPYRKPDARHLLDTIAAVGGDPARSALVGDTITDRKAGANASVPVVLVLFGPEGEGVLDLQPDQTIASYENLPRVLEDMHPLP
jgi:phosphoglycolate phosphatase